MYGDTQDEEENTGERILLNGVEIILQSDRETKFEEGVILYRKRNRADLDKQGCLVLIAAATEKKETTYFIPMSLGLSKESKLDDWYSCQMKIEKVEACNCPHDMHNGYTIAKPLP
jgi:hypothetical protein